jgi:hypothetical protein
MATRVTGRTGIDGNHADGLSTFVFVPEKTRVKPSPELHLGFFFRQRADVLLGLTSSVFWFTECRRSPPFLVDESGGVVRAHVREGTFSG